MKEYEPTALEHEETMKRKVLGLPACQLCRERLAGYSIEQPNGDILQVCKRCLLDELGR